MSILIKGMEMPKNCAVCRLEKDLFGRAICFGYEDGRALHKDDLPPVGNEERRPDWCPLVPVPKHGRLIDADALKNSLAFAESTARWAVPALRAVLMVIDEMPTIIESEDE